MVKLFSPTGAATWLVSELDPEQPDIAFGLADLGFGCPELGSFRVSELQSVRGPFGAGAARPCAQPSPAFPVRVAFGAAQSRKKSIESLGPGKKRSPFSIERAQFFAPLDFRRPPKLFSLPQDAIKPLLTEWRFNRFFDRTCPHSSAAAALRERLYFEQTVRGFTSASTPSSCPTIHSKSGTSPRIIFRIAP